MRTLFCVLALVASSLVGSAQVRAVWQDNSDNEDNFHIERRLESAAIWILIGSTGPDVTMFDDAQVFPGEAYVYRVRASNAAGYSSYSNEASVVIPITGLPPDAPILLNLVQSGRLSGMSVRGLTMVGDDILIGGLVIEDGPCEVLIRALGPTLAGLGVPGALSDPQIAILSGQTVIAQNDNWSGVAVVSAMATANGGNLVQLPVGSKDAALVITLQPGAYTYHVSGVGGATGVALIEAYEIK